MLIRSAHLGKPAPSSHIPYVFISFVKVTMFSSNCTEILRSSESHSSTITILNCFKYYCPDKCLRRVVGRSTEDVGELILPYNLIQAN